MKIARKLINFLKNQQASIKTLAQCNYPVIIGTIKTGQQNYKCNQNVFSNLTNINIRYKYTKGPKGTKQDEDSESDNENDNDFKDEKDSKVVKIRLNSLRADLILKAGLGMARNKVETIFYESRIRVNGEKLTKKSLQLNVGDDIDVIKGVSSLNSSHLTIARVTILSALEKDENLLVNLRRFKNLIIDNYEGNNEWKSS